MGKWINCSDGQPTKADEDCRGMLWAAYRDPITKAKTKPELKSASLVLIFSQSNPEAHFWMPTGLIEPEPPEHKDEKR